MARCQTSRPATRPARWYGLCPLAPACILLSGVDFPARQGSWSRWRARRFSSWRTTRTIVRILVYRLRKIGEFDIREATNGQEALEEVRRDPPHVIFMDLKMPVMDGWEATRRLRAMAGETRSASSR